VQQQELLVVQHSTPVPPTPVDGQAFDDDDDEQAAVSETKPTNRAATGSTLRCPLDWLITQIQRRPRLRVNVEAWANVL
jgi:hypothetical protein